MTPNDLLRRARAEMSSKFYGDTPKPFDKEVERLLVLAQAAEREACAKAVEDYDETDGAVTGRHVLATAIRARGQS